MDNLIKICGLSTPETLDAALDAGADLVGFVRFAKSPRHVSPGAGHRLSLQAKGRAQRVVLLVDPTRRGHRRRPSRRSTLTCSSCMDSETPERVAEIRGASVAAGHESDRHRGARAISRR